MSLDMQGPGLWYVTRATGLVALLMLTASVLLGLLAAGRFGGERWPRFLTQGLHRNVSLLVVAFLTLHVASTVLDTYTSIPLTAAFIPFASGYKPGLAIPRGGRPRPARRADRHQPCQGTAGLPDVARDALAGLCVLAGGGGARPRDRHGQVRDLGDRADDRLHGLRRHRGRLASPHLRSTMNTLTIARGGLPRLLAGLSYYRPPNLADHERTYGPLPVVGRRFIDVVDASGLTGRGGAGFPAGRKMRGVAAGRGAKIVVANGCEGEPASSKDRLLLTRLPHLVLDGVEAAAMAVGAAEAYVCVHQHDTELLASLEAAVAERDEPGPGDRDRCPWQVRR